MDRRACRYNQRIGSCDALVLIVKLPPPLVTNCNHIDLRADGWLCLRRDLNQTPDSEDENDEQEKGRNNSPEQF